MSKQRGDNNQIVIVYERTCPVCGGATSWHESCPGWLQGGTVMQCVPSCGNGILYKCLNIKCGWQYMDPPGPRYQNGVKPEWLREDVPR